MNKSYSMKTESWDKHDIRFVEHSGEWWAVAKDVCDALGLSQTSRALGTLKGVTKSKVPTDGGEQEVNIICEKDIYRLVFKSRKSEAESFQDWVFDVLKTLREKNGLEGFEIFRTLDRQYQREAMHRLSTEIKTVRAPVRLDFVKANTIVNKAVSNRHGYAKMVKKADMSPRKSGEVVIVNKTKTRAEKRYVAQQRILCVLFVVIVALAIICAVVLA